MSATDNPQESNQISSTLNTAPVVEKKELPFKPEFILKNYKHLTNDQIAIALSTPELTSHLLSVISKFNDNQLCAAAPLLTLEQVKATIPKLQLQQTGAAVQVMNPAQIRQAVASLTHDDRNILNQNIALLSSSSNKDELQSFMAFVDPLAICIAVQNTDLITKLIASAGVMTKEQLRVVVPLLKSTQIRDLIAILEDEAQINTALEMIFNKEELFKLLKEDFSTFQKRQSDLVPRSLATEKILPELETRIKSLSLASNALEEYESIVRLVRNTKTEIETLQQSVREIQAELKLPLRTLSESDALTQFQQLSNEVVQLGKQFRSQFSTLDGLINLLSQYWQQIEKERSRSNSSSKEESAHSRRETEASTSDSVFEDDDQAIVLYEAIKSIGNPDAVGNHYTFTWNDIIHAGFRSSKDFRDKGISSLEQLQQFIEANRSKTVV